MVDIVAERGDGTTYGTPIVDPVLTSVDVALARARTELDDNATVMSEVSITIPFAPSVQRGSIVNVSDISLGENYNGIVTRFSHKTKNGAVVTELTLIEAYN